MQFFENISKNVYLSWNIKIEFMWGVLNHLHSYLWNWNYFLTVQLSHTQPILHQSGKVLYRHWPSLKIRTGKKAILIRIKSLLTHSHKQYVIWRHPWQYSHVVQLGHHLLFYLVHTWWYSIVMLLLESLTIFFGGKFLLMICKLKILLWWRIISRTLL